MKENSGANLTEVAKIFGALFPHDNVTRVTNSSPKLSPLSTHSKQAVLRFRSSGYFGHLSVLYIRAAFFLHYLRSNMNLHGGCFAFNLSSFTVKDNNGTPEN